MAQGEGFWINQANVKNAEDIKDILNNTIILNHNHIKAVARNLESESPYFPFPISRKEYNQVYDYYKEKYGFEGKAREIILLILTCVYDFIRFRVNLTRQQESVIFGTGQVDAKTILIAKTLFKYLNSQKNKIVKDEMGHPYELYGSQELDVKILQFQSYNKLLDSNYTKKEKEEIMKAVPDRYKKRMKEILRLDKSESSYMKAKRDIDFKQENTPKIKSVYIPSKERIAMSHGSGRWIYNVGEMLKQYKLTLSDIKKFATDEEYVLLEKYYKEKK